MWKIDVTQVMKIKQNIWKNKEKLQGYSWNRCRNPLEEEKGAKGKYGLDLKTFWKINFLFKVV